MSSLEKCLFKSFAHVLIGLFGFLVLNFLSSLEILDISPLSDASMNISPFSGLSFLFSRFYLFIFREKGRERERERNISVWLTLTPSLLGTWPINQACALTGNQTINPLVCRPALSLLSHTSQGGLSFHLLMFSFAVQKLFSLI